MTPRYKRRKSIPRYKPRNIRLADPVIAETFQALQEIRAEKEGEVDMPDFVNTEFWDQCERECWDRLMAFLIRLPMPCD